MLFCVLFFFFKQKTAYEMRISDWSSEVCSSDLRDVQALPHVVEAQGHGERRLVQFQVPELVLDDDGHFVRILRAQMLRQPHVRMIGAECDVEMMVARQAMPADLDQRLAQHAAQRALDHSDVSQQISHEFGSIRPSPAFPPPVCASEDEWGGSVSRCPPDRAFLS